MVFHVNKITITTQDLLTFTNAATILQVTRQTIYNMLERQELHPVVIGRNRYLLRSEVKRLKEEKKVA